MSIYRGPAPFHRLTPNKRFEPVFSTVIMAVCSLFNRMLLLTDLIPVHLLYSGQTVMIGCNHTSFEWTRAVRHIYGIIRHMQGLYNRPVSHSARHQRPARERHKIRIASRENVDNQAPRNTNFTLARFTLLLNVDITILYPNTQTLTVYM